MNTYYCSFSPQFGVARSFAEGQSGKSSYQSNRTIFKIDPQFAQVAVDASWISPFPQEQEVIIKISQCKGFYDPTLLLNCARRCKKLDCFHARYSLKQLTLVDADEKKNYFEQCKTLWQQIMERLLANFRIGLDKGSQFG